MEHGLSPEPKPIKSTRPQFHESIPDPETGDTIAGPVQARKARIWYRVREILGPRCRMYPDTVKEALRQAKRNKYMAGRRKARVTAYLREYDAYVKACHKAGKIPYK